MSDPTEKKRRAQLLLAAFMWTAASAMLGIRGVNWLTHVHFGLALAATAVALGWLKQRFIMQKVANGAIERIRTRDPRANIFGFFSVKSWLIVAFMMGGGIALRHTGMPTEILGTLYATVAIGLLLGSRRFWREAAQTA